MLTPVQPTLFVTTLTALNVTSCRIKVSCVTSEGYNDTPFRADGRGSVKPSSTKCLKRIDRRPSYLLDGFRERVLLGTQSEPRV